jgi:hypothetical protein
MPGVLLPEEFVSKFLSIFHWGIFNVAIDLIEGQEIVANIWRQDGGAPTLTWVDL